MPGLRSTLGIRVNDGQTDRIVTGYSSGLKFTKVAPGGHQSLSFRLVLPRNTFNDLGPEDRVYVYDGHTTRTIIEGYLENPTPTDGPDGQQYDISAVGGMALGNDETRGLIYVDRSLDAFERATDSTSSGEIDVADWTDDATYKRLRTNYPSGSTVAQGTWISAGNNIFDRAAMNLGALRVGQVDGGKTDGNWVTDFVTTSGIVAGSGTTLAVLAGTYTAYVGASNFPTGIRRF